MIIENKSIFRLAELEKPKSGLNSRMYNVIAQTGIVIGQFEKCEQTISNSGATL